MLNNIFTILKKMYMNVIRVCNFLVITFYSHIYHFTLHLTNITLFLPVYENFL